MQNTWIPLGKQTYTIPANNYFSVPIKVLNPADGFYIITFFLHQPTNLITDEVPMQILDKDNYNLWVNNNQLVKGGVNPEKLIHHNAIAVAKVATSAISFVPQASGDFNVVLENRDQTAQKTIDVELYWISYDITLVAIRELLLKKEWINVWNELNKGVTARLIPEKQSDACNNFRVALALFLVKVCEKITGTSISFDAGKSTDIGSLKSILRAHRIPDDVVGLVGSTWSFLSERSHLERAKKQPQPLEVTYGYNMLLAMFEYMLSLHLDIYE